MFCCFIQDKFLRYTPSQFNLDPATNFAMSNKNLFKLLSPGILLLMIATGAFLFGNLVTHDLTYEPLLKQYSRQGFERFVENVRSGNRQMTTDQWIERLRVEQNVTVSSEKISLFLAKVLRMIGSAILFCVLYQAWVIFSYKRNINKSSTPTGGP